MTALLILAFGSDPAHGHCFSRWFYPTPQHCGGSYRPPAPPDPPKRIYAPDFVIPAKPEKDTDMPIPDVTFPAVEEPDQLTDQLLRLLARGEE